MISVICLNIVVRSLDVVFSAFKRIGRGHYNKLSSYYPSDEKCDFVPQINSAIVSFASNIAEGTNRNGNQ